MGVELSLVKRWWNKPNVSGSEKTGRPTIFTRKFLSELFSRTNLKLKRSNRIIARQMHCSTRSIVLGHNLLGQHAFHRRKEPNLTENQIHKRLKFAKSSINTNWANILFTDEKNVVALSNPIATTMSFTLFKQFVCRILELNLMN
jgi:hypothetical protein